MKMKQKTIIVLWGDKEEEVVVKEFSWGEWCDIENDCLQRKIVGDAMIEMKNSAKAKELMMLKGIVKAPFEVKRESIRGLPRNVGKQIFSAIEEVNNEKSE